jgi:hypothetical protein
MNPLRFWRPVVALALFGAIGSAQALDNPPIRMAQGIEYMCGGTSRAEAAFMQTVSPRWAASFAFAVGGAKAGDLPGEVKVVVRERYTGRFVMQATSADPYMLARLDPGAYEVEATLAGLSLTQPIVVFNGMSSSAAFVWPSNVDYLAASGQSQPVQQASAGARR